jgi:hypothetical protein
MIHETRGGLYVWYPVGLIVEGPKLSEGAAAEFDMIRICRIDCIEPIGPGWLPG